jgi:hypothetical protein
MPIYRDSSIGTQFATLQDFQPSAAASFDATTRAAWATNPSVLLYDAGQLRDANDAERLSGYEASTIARSAGFPELAPGDGEYTRGALDMILERKREERVRSDVMMRTPYSWTGTPVRALASVGANLLDPLNIAAAYVPLIAPARYTALLAGAGGLAERTAIRAGVGAAQGAVGMAAIEPALYAAHTYLGDDYTMRDSLLNIGFGGAFGGGLHAVAGALGDAMVPGKWAKPMSVTDAIAHDVTPVLTRTGAELPKPGSAAALAESAAPETRQAALRTAVAQLADGRAVDVDSLLYLDPRTALARALAADAPATIQAARQRVLAALTPDLLARLKPETGQVDSGALIAMRDELIAKEAQVGALLRTGPLREAGGAFDPLRVAAQGADLRTRIAALDSALSANADLAALKAGRIPERYAAEVGAAAQREMAGGPRQTPLSTAVQTAYERPPILRPGEYDPIRLIDELRATAAQHASPDAHLTAEPATVAAADERLASAPKSEEAIAADQAATEAGARLEATLMSLKASGTADKTLARFRTAMEPFTAAVNEAEAMGNALRAAALCGIRQ